MHLTLYADRPGRRARQIVADLAVLAWVWLWVRIGQAVHDAVHAVSGVGYTLQDGAASIGSNLTDAGSGVGDVPLVGSALGKPLTSAGSAADRVSDAGRRLGDGIGTLSVLLALLVAVLPIVTVVAVWLVLRLRFAYRAALAADLSGQPAGDRLLALRALTRRPLSELRPVDPDPVEAWRRDDPEVIRALAALELARCGVRSRPASTPA